MKYFLMIPVLLIAIGLGTLVHFEMTNAEEDPILHVSDLKDYDHNLMTAEGGSLDKWNAIKENQKEIERSHERIQRVWEYTNSIDARVYELEQKLQSRTEKQETKVTMISNEGGQVLKVDNMSINPMIRKSKSTQDRELQSLVNDAVSVYLSETGRNPVCYVGSSVVSLGDIMHAKIIQEGGYELNSAGRKTNNPGSLRNNGVLRQVVSFSHIDNTKKWRVYGSMQDGLVDLAYVIDQKYDCKISINGLFAYVYGPNAEKTQGRMDHIRAIWNNFYARLAQ